MRAVWTKLRTWWGRWSWPTTASLSVVVLAYVAALSVLVVRLLWAVLFHGYVLSEGGRLLLAMALGFGLALTLVERLGFYWKRTTYKPDAAPAQTTISGDTWPGGGVTWVPAPWSPPDAPVLVPRDPTPGHASVEPAAGNAGWQAVQAAVQAEPPAPAAPALLPSQRRKPKLA